jgi:hypothetical protein
VLLLLLLLLPLLLLQRRLSELVGASEPGDVLFFHYSGHGTQVMTPAFARVEIATVQLEEPACGVL